VHGGGLPLHPLAPLEAPSLADFEALATYIFERLPASFRALCGEVVIRVDDFPEDDVLEEMEAETEYEILGLFQGVGLAQGGAQPAAMPNMVFLYRRPILDYWAEHRETLGAVVAHVLIHEIGHHFGLSDADMEKLEAEAG
jgi:predicted Zn-dependent protease with MMP-like domain